MPEPSRLPAGGRPLQRPREGEEGDDVGRPEGSPGGARPVRRVGALSHARGAQCLRRLPRLRGPRWLSFGRRKKNGELIGLMKIWKLLGMFKICKLIGMFKIWKLSSGLIEI